MMGPRNSRGWARTTDMRLQRPPFFQLNYPGSLTTVILHGLFTSCNRRPRPALRPPNVLVWLWQFGQSIRRFSMRQSFFTPFMWSI